MSLPQPNPNARAVVTGASSGIGEQLARHLAARGHSLMLVARRVDKLEALADELRQAHGVEVDLRPCDLTDRDARAQFRDELAGTEVSILCNNAGFATVGRLAENESQRERDELELNTMAVQDLTLAVLPGMIKRGAGALLIVGSTAGHQPLPGNTTYSASKAFANTFSESLHGELKGSGVTCTLLAPGPVKTEFFGTAEMASIEGQGGRMIWQNAERVAQLAVEGMERGRRLVVPGAMAHLMTAGGRYTPRRMLLPMVEKVVGRVI